jgi:thiamine kinase-like enzyme
MPETLLHGDLWGSNIVFCDTVAGREVRLIDWDHAGVGPLTYDLSTLVYRLPKGDRQWAVDCYQRHITSSVWRAPSTRILNLLFETAELARLANRLIWPAIAVLDGQPDWGFSELTVVGGWFDALEPALPEQVGRAGWEARK